MADLVRTLGSAIEKTSRGFRVVLLNGQRQVGKSTLLKNMSKGTKRKHVSLDDMDARKLAQQDPELFLQQNPPPVIIDEIQYAPELFPYIKIYADENRANKGGVLADRLAKIQANAGRTGIAGRPYRYSGSDGIFIPRKNKKTVFRQTVSSIHGQVQ